MHLQVPTHVLQCGEAHGFITVLGHAASTGDAPAPSKDHFRGPHVGAPFLTTADVDRARMLGMVLK